MRKLLIALVLAGVGCSAEPDVSPTVPAETFEQGAGAGGSGEVLQEKRIATH